MNSRYPRISSAACAALMTLLFLPGAGRADSYVAVSGDVGEGHKMDCPTEESIPWITLYESKNEDSGSEHITFKNMEWARLGELKISASSWDILPEGENDAFHSFKINGTWEICLDRDYGRCKLMGFNYTRYYASDPEMQGVAGEISSLRPVGCRGGVAANITMNTGKLRKPENDAEKTTMCLSSSQTGTIANNGRIHLKWIGGGLKLVLNKTHEIVWSTQTDGQEVCFNPYGNLVIAGAGNQQLWTTNTSDPNAQLVLDDTCNLKVASGGKTLWSSGTTCE